MLKIQNNILKIPNSNIIIDKLYLTVRTTKNNINVLRVLHDVVVPIRDVSILYYRIIYILYKSR